MEGYHSVASEVECCVVAQSLSSSDGRYFLWQVDDIFGSGNVTVGHAFLHCHGLDGHVLSHLDSGAVNCTTCRGIVAIGGVIDGSTIGSTVDFNILHLGISTSSRRERRGSYLVRVILLIQLDRLLSITAAKITEAFLT